MRFDSTPYYHVGEAYPWEILVGEMRQEVELLDQAGFTGFWLAEHHFAWDGWYRSSPNPILLGADLARRSNRLRVGQCGTIIPDWHPIRVAEDIALLDQLTKGRVDFGIARGFNTRASIQFNIDADRRNEKLNSEYFNECLDVILGTWTQDAFRYSGKFFTFPVPGWKETHSAVHDPLYHAQDGELIALGVYPRPYQKPHPPVWQMSTTNISHELAGKRGINTMCQAISFGKIREVWTTYQEAASEARGRDVPFGDGLAVMVPVYVADTIEQAARDCRRGANMLGLWGSRNPQKHVKINFVPGEVKEEDLQLDWYDFQLKYDLLMVGSPDSVSEQIERLRSELNCQHLALFLNIPGLSFSQVMHSLELFGEKVMPRFT